MYQCSATNEAATITTETELVVENVPPRAPHNLTVELVDNGVMLKWKAGRRRPQLEYSVWYKPVDTPEWRTLKVSSKKSLEANILNLSPGNNLIKFC